MKMLTIVPKVNSSVHKADMLESLSTMYATDVILSRKWWNHTGREMDFTYCFDGNCKIIIPDDCV